MFRNQESTLGIYMQATFMKGGMYKGRPSTLTLTDGGPEILIILKDIDGLFFRPKISTFFSR